MPQPSASETRWAATSRRVSVPTGKSNSGRSPAVGFQTASRSVGSSGFLVSAWRSGALAGAPPEAASFVEGGRTRTTIALFDEPRSRPMTSSSPARSSARTSPAPGSVDVVAVLARADVAGRIERVSAQRAGRPAGADDAEGAFHEGAGCLGGEADAQEVRPVVVIVLELDDRLVLALLVVLARRPCLDEDAFRVAVPAEGQGGRAEGLVQRLVERP